MDLKNIDMVVEISANTNIKYEIDKQTNLLRCDRILNIPFTYPGNYGYIPNTLSLDNDPLDILLINTEVLVPNTIIKVKILGVLLTEDENGEDEKIIAVPDNNVDKSNQSINDINDLTDHILNYIKYFFSHYKDNETNKWVKVDSYRGREEALKIIYNSHERFKNQLVTDKSV